MISSKERRVIFEQALVSESNSQERCLWMSFCDTEKPKGQQFIGVVITHAKGIAHAIDKTHKLGINPGGEVFSYETDATDIDLAHFDILLSKEDLITAGYV